jgi:hypothetical protein
MFASPDRCMPLAKFWNYAVVAESENPLGSTVIWVDCVCAMTGGEFKQATPRAAQIPATRHSVGPFPLIAGAFAGWLSQSSSALSHLGERISPHHHKAPWLISSRVTSLRQFSGRCLTGL